MTRALRADEYVGVHHGIALRCFTAPSYDPPGRGGIGTVHYLWSHEVKGLASNLITPVDRQIELFSNIACEDYFSIVDCPELIESLDEGEPPTSSDLHCRCHEQRLGKKSGRLKCSTG